MNKNDLQELSLETLGQVAGGSFDEEMGMATHLITTSSNQETGSGGGGNVASTTVGLRG